MRFVKNGPDIPDALLIARDQGRVVFFCGAGVSRAFAKLPGFPELARKACDLLGIPAGDSIREKIGTEEAPGTLDQVFSFLEREFKNTLLEKAVAESLKPTILDEAQLQAHRSLLNLATTPDGRVQLVTTNFDRLFTTCDSTLRLLHPPNFPDPLLSGELNGLIHLHGCVTEDYVKAEHGGLVLSSVAFGKAYLAEGWATDFFKKILSKYLVVFVGYSAEDLPMRYLLEALGEKSDSQGKMYAFQKDASDVAAAKWAHKGVTAIPYSEHASMWNTLEAWAARASDIDKWQFSVITKAQQGPKKLAPYERGQVAHVISTEAGAKLFADNAPSAEWLCVFDAQQRYSAPGRMKDDYSGPIIDPFTHYHLDSDKEPPYVSESLQGRRESLRLRADIANAAWDAFRRTEADRKKLENDNGGSFQGYAILSPRIQELGKWLAKVSCQPAAVWWAARQKNLHSGITDQIRWSLQNCESPDVIHAWHHFFEAWGGAQSHANYNWYYLKAIIDKIGWTSSCVKYFAAMHKPYLKIDSFFSNPIPPQADEGFSIHNLFHFTVEYPGRDSQSLQPDEIPKNALEYMIRQVRNNIEYAIQLEKEICHYGYQYLASIHPEDGTNSGIEHRNEKLSGHVLFFASLFERLVDHDIIAARNEFACWPVDDDFAFSMLRIWAAGLDSLFSPEVAGEIFLNMSDTAFHAPGNQRDLLIVLKKRWNDFSKPLHKKLEARLLKGRDFPEHSEARVYQILNRLRWLADNGSEFSFDSDLKIRELQKDVPSWKSEYAAHAARSLGAHTISVQTTTNYEKLLEIPLREVLDKAWKIKRQSEFSSEAKHNDPYSGLAKERPVRAWCALIRAMKDKKASSKCAGMTFFEHSARVKDRLRLKVHISQRVLSLPNDVVKNVFGSLVYWLSNVSRELSEHAPEVFDALVRKLIETLQRYSHLNRSMLVREKSQPNRWSDFAYHSHVRRIIAALLQDSRLGGEDISGLPEQWSSHAETLLKNKKTRFFSLALFSRDLPFLYKKDLAWAETNLVSVLTGPYKKEDFHAAWDGFLYNTNFPCLKLYEQLYPILFRMIKENNFPHHSETSAAFIFNGWSTRVEGAQESLISDNEFRELLWSADNKFRFDVLLCIHRWLRDEEIQSQLWYKRLPEFFKGIWPKRRDTQTELLSAKLCDIIFANEAQFPQLVDILYDQLERIPKHYLFEKYAEDYATSYPAHMLKLLWAILSDNARDWPYGTAGVLDKIIQADEKLKVDEVYIKIKCRLDSKLALV